MEPTNLFLLLMAAVIYALIGFLLARDFYLSEYASCEMSTVELTLIGFIFLVWPLLLLGLIVTGFLLILDPDIRGKLWKR